MTDESMEDRLRKMEDLSIEDKLRIAENLGDQGTTEGIQEKEIEELKRNGDKRYTQEELDAAVQKAIKDYEAKLAEKMEPLLVKLNEIKRSYDEMSEGIHQQLEKYSDFRNDDKPSKLENKPEENERVEIVEAPQRVVDPRSSSFDAQSMALVALEHIFIDEYRLKVSFPKRDGAMFLEIPKIRGGVSHLYYHNGLLYHGVWDEPAGVWETVSGKKLTNDHTKDNRRVSNVWRLISFNGKLYHSIGYTDSSDSSGGAVLETLTGTVIAERPDIITDLCVHNGVLYDAHGDVFETFTGKCVYHSYDPKSRCDAIFSYDGKLCSINFDTDCSYHFFDAISGKKFASIGVNEKKTGRFKELYDTMGKHLKRKEVLVPISFAEELVKSLKQLYEK